MLDSTRKTPPIVRLIGGVMFLSFSAVFVRLADVPPTVSAFYRNLIGAAILLGIVYLRREPLFGSLGALFALFVASVFFAMDLWFWHRSIVIVGPGLATLLASFQVFVLALVGILLLREGLRWDLIVSIPMAIVGLAMIVGFEWSALDSMYRLGVIFGLLAALLYAGYLLSLRWARLGAYRSSAFGDLAMVSVFSVVLLGWASWMEGASLQIPSLADAGWLTAYGIFSQVIGWVLVSSGIHQVPASRVGFVILLQPLLTFVWDVLFFARSFSMHEAAGAALALSAIYLGARRRATPVRPE